jgi:leucyl-tRNA---protein transferase
MTLEIYACAPHPCNYLPERLARSQVVVPGHEVDAATYSALVVRGFRRSGFTTYRPACPGCRACVPLRVPVQNFQPTRSQRRAWKAHQFLEACVLPLSFESEHYALYQRYQHSRHVGAGMDHDDVQEYTDFLMQSHVQTMLVEFRLPHPHHALGLLKMVSVVDILADGLSAVYTFFEPEPRTSYGTYNVLWQIEQTRQRQLPYCYLGYWISQSPKMAYKAQFGLHEVLIGGQWQAQQTQQTQSTQDSLAP